MLDIADLVFEDSSPPPAGSGSARAVNTSSPLRPWGMWSGWTAIGIACAGAVAHAVTRIRARHRVVPELSPLSAQRSLIVPAG
jgi:hypothetical protein